MVQIEVTYGTYGSHTIELPEGKTWDDVENFWVKWDTAHIQFKGDPTDHTYELETGYDPEDTDMKRPSSVEVYETDDEGNVDYERPLVSE